MGGGNLPAIELPRTEVDIAGRMVTIRSLTRAEALHLKMTFSEATADEAEVYAVSCGADVELDEARRWLAATGFEDGTKLVEAIMALSGLSEKTNLKA